MPTITVRDEVYQRFKDAVYAKHGTTYGTVKEEAEAALLSYVEAGLARGEARGKGAIEGDPMAGLIGRGSLKEKDWSERKDWRA
ncbi:MAG TPA: hypothetical protein VM582_09430 [Candidatus Thermoplasmatota archaeon]|nr:hypothetical protein [Candidatus Thermoplasmatota archaeon]